MELGMIGLGRMGANMVIRLMKAGHTCVVYDTHPEAVQRWWPRVPWAPPTSPALSRPSSKPRLVWLMVPAAAVDPVLASLVPLLEPGDIVVDGGNSYYHDDMRRAGDLQREGAALRRCRRQRRRLGAGARLLPDDRRRTRGRAAPRSDLPRAGARIGRRAAHAGPWAIRGSAEHGLSALRPERCRALREDGPQRHRVRADGGLRRRAEHPEARQRRAEDPRGRRRDHAAARTPSSTTTTSTSRRSPKSGGAAAWSASWLLDLAAAALRTSPTSTSFARPRLRLRRGPLDAAGRDRRGRSGAGDLRRRSRALHVSRGEADFARPPAVGDALRVRRPRREAERSRLHGGPTAVARIALRLLRRHRRPRLSSRSSPRSLGLVRDEGLDVPIIGVAKPGWSARQAAGAGRARACAHGASDAAAYREALRTAALRRRRLRRSDDLRTLRGELGEAQPASPLSGDSAERCSRTVVDGLAAVRAARTMRGSWSRSRSGTTCASAWTLNAMLPARLPGGPRSSGSIITSARSRSRTCSTSGSPTRFSSRSGIATTSRSVQITMAEDFGVRGRGRFYERGRRDPRRRAEPSAAGAGASWPWSRPRASDAEAIRDEKAKLLKAMRPLEPADVVRGQYRGYRDVAGVAPDSHRRDVRRGAAVHRHLALGRRAVLHPRRQVVCRSPRPRSWST